jgi:ankyrin repeat protein
VVKLLLANGADPARVDDRGHTPLAAAVGNVEVGRPETTEVVRLLKAVAGPSDLRSAVMEGDAARVRAILMADPKAVTAHPDPGDLLLTAVVGQEEAGSTEIIELLLAHGADPNTPSRQWPELPIARAVDSETVELLVKYGAKQPRGRRHGRQ